MLNSKKKNKKRSMHHFKNTFSINKTSYTWKKISFNSFFFEEVMYFTMVIQVLVEKTQTRVRTLLNKIKLFIILLTNEKFIIITTFNLAF